MNEYNNMETQVADEEKSSFNFQTIFTAFILNWKWFLLSVIVCLGIGVLYLRYTTPIYNTVAKLLIKDDDSNNSRGRVGAMQALESMSNMGIISNSYGVENEQEILTSTTIAQEAIRDLKLYVKYYKKGRVKDVFLYKEQPINIDLDNFHLNKLNAPIKITITKKGDSYEIKGSYSVAVDEIYSKGPFEFERTIRILPASISIGAGTVTFAKNNNHIMENGETLIAVINPLLTTAIGYVNALSVEQTSKTSSVFNLQLKDENISKGMDYLRQLIVCYNRQANEDKNEMAIRTEEFINDRLLNINAELSSTDDALASY